MKVLLVLALAIAACTSTQVPSVAPSPAVPAVVTPATRSAAERTECARSVLTTFIDAFNRGDSAHLMTYFKTTDGPRSFKWFYTPGTPAYGPSLTQLPDYFATWHATGERWRVVNLDVGAGPSWHGGVDFAIEIERAWPDRSMLNGGKGALDCDARTIFVFALGDPLR
jgi:hypothetical protein